MSEVLQYLTKHGERLDSEIAAETGMPLATVRQRVAGLAAAGEVITCTLTRHAMNGKITHALVTLAAALMLAAVLLLPSRAAGQEARLLFRVTFDDLTANAQIAQGNPKSSLGRNLGLTDPPDRPRAHRRAVLH